MCVNFKVRSFHFGIIVTIIPPILLQVLKETLRLWPPAAGVTRKLTKEYNAHGYKIPAGANCQFNTYVMGRMEEYFHDPEKFDPERFKNHEDT